MKNFIIGCLALSAAAMTLLSCGGSNSPSPTTIKTSTNSPPQVNAGDDQSVSANTSVTLTATASDADGRTLQYMWTQTAGAGVEITNASQLSASFTSPTVQTGDVLMFEFRATDSQGAFDTDDIQITVAPPQETSSCSVSAVPNSLRGAPYNLDGFYQKYCDALGLPILGSVIVTDEAIKAAEERVTAMISRLEPEVLQAMIDLNTRVAIMAQSEVTTDIPEHSDLYEAFPGTDWDVRARGLGATPERPAISGAEENVLCLSGDTYAGEDILMHEFAHAIHIMGLKIADASFEQNLTSAFNNANSLGLWADTYAATNKEEYWAEGVQSWFNVNQSPQDGIHNDKDTRAELENYDQVLYDLIETYLPSDYQPSCPE